MTKNGKTDKMINTLADGLIGFYSSQAEMMLAQYKNINRLLGPTNDWTHPGSHCEILLRDFLRRNLLQWMSVDKGYIYGRTRDKDQTSHCPEIDILIHNTKDHTPIFKLDDFVIVEPESVLGIIQVKRSFNKVGETDPLDKGLKQVIGAKQFLLDLLIEKRPRNTGPFSIVDLNRSIFSAVVAFDKASKVSLQDAIIARYNAHRLECRYGESDVGKKASIAMLPTFVGSLSGDCAYARRNIIQQKFCLYNAKSLKGNCSLQLLLLNLMSELDHFVPLTRPFAFPEFPSVSSFLVPPDK